MASSRVISGIGAESLAGPANPAGYRTRMWIFTALAVLAVCCAIGLRRVETGPRAQGLETIRAQRR
jgi:hypothetical protein